ncbi:MAG TPA: MarR family transcriptional regulator [Micromonosporaceae bacterium]|jgi:biotin operon repressor
MPTDAEVTFADHAGSLYARRYGFPPMVGRLLGYLAICDPREQSIADLADALRASRSAITGAIKSLETAGLVQRSRSAGERMDRVRIDLTSPQAFGFDVTEYVEQADLAREGLGVLKGTPIERRAVLLHWAAFADFLAANLPALEKKWKAHRAALVKAGKLPDESTL